MRTRLAMATLAAAILAAGTHRATAETLVVQVVGGEEGEHVIIAKGRHFNPGPDMDFDAQSIEPHPMNKSRGFTVFDVEPGDYVVIYSLFSWKRVTVREGSPPITVELHGHYCGDPGCPFFTGYSGGDNGDGGGEGGDDGED